MGNANGKEEYARAGVDAHATARPNGDGDPGSSAALSPSPKVSAPQMMDLAGPNSAVENTRSGAHATARPNGDGDPSVNSSQPHSPGSPTTLSPSPNFFAPQEKRIKEAEFYTNVHNLRKMSQDLLEKGYNEKGFSVATMVKCLMKNSKDPEDIPYCELLVGGDSMVSNVGSSYCYWDLSTRIDYKHSPLSKKVFGLDIILDNKPKVSGDISLCFDDYAKLTSGFGWRDHLESKMELLFFGELAALKLRGSGFGSDSFDRKRLESYLPERMDIAAAVYKSGMTLAAEGSCDKTWKPLSYCIGGAIQTNDCLASVIYWRESLIGSCVKKFSNQFDVGIEVAKAISSKRYTVTLGVCKNEPGQMYKMKINNCGVLNGSIERNLWAKAVVSISSQVDVKNVFNRPKFGLKVLFNPPAVTQTYDIGTERWEKS